MVVLFVCEDMAVSTQTGGESEWEHSVLLYLGILIIINREIPWRHHGVIMCSVLARPEVARYENDISLWPRHSSGMHSTPPRERTMERGCRAHVFWGITSLRSLCSWYPCLASAQNGAKWVVKPRGDWGGYNERLLFFSIKQSLVIHET